MKLRIGLTADSLKVVYALMIFTLSTSTAHAQRTMNGQDNISASVQCTFSGEVPIGADLCWGRYLLNSNVKAGLSYSPFSHKIYTTRLSDSRTIQNHSLLAYGEYMHRIVADRGRHTCLYAGGGVFLGCEFYDPQKKLPDYIVTGLGDWGFLYGICPAVEFEVFVSKTICILIRGGIPINFSSPLSNIRFTTGIGARFNIY